MYSKMKNVSAILFATIFLLTALIWSVVTDII